MNGPPVRPRGLAFLQCWLSLALLARPGEADSCWKSVTIVLFAAAYCEVAGWESQSVKLVASRRS